ncbi:multicopper oxidase [Viridothelium virens]|uniref:Multicopper oxidase n=1 Tax=Viridothelium virens TaxID=1048519 RepID=A0A6A6H6J0_VIRVR|nr:multicopper oxidase [Viridothelium virens]
MHRLDTIFPSILICFSYLATGLFSLETLDSPSLAKFLTRDGTPLPSGTPWDSSDPAGSAPRTGVIRSYDWVISRGYGDPDGFNRSLILINGRYPGPLVEANWGDTIQVTVHNQIYHPGEGLSIHWHGQPQTKSPWMDGVPSVSQCPIASGSSFTYTFTAEVYGTSWYHSHVSAQYIDGLYGPMIIYGPSHVSYDIDVGPILLTDYTHVPYYEFISDTYDRPAIFLPIENNLINGRNPFQCNQNLETCNTTAAYSRFRFYKGKKHRLRVMNTGGTANQKFTIDDHRLTVIANDYVPIIPYTTDVVTLGVGQRTDVIVIADMDSDSSVWMRADIDTGELCGNTTTILSHARAAIYYEDANMDKLPSSSAKAWDSNNCANDPLEQTVPFYPQTPPLTPETTQVYDLRYEANETGSIIFFVNETSFRADYNNPILLLAYLDNTSYPYDPEWNVNNFGVNKSIRAIFRNYFPGPHPLHLHGHNFWVLAEGVGDWDGSIVNPENPQRRDTHILGPGTEQIPSFVVFEWLNDNPGVWPFHCHIVIHVSLGLYINSMEHPDLIKQQQIPAIMAQTCRDWAKWSGQNVVDQIDSGL